MSDSEENSGRFSDSSESESDFGAVGGQVEPYMFEPEAVEGAGVVVEEEDEDGLSPDILEARKEKRIPFSVWCKCGACGDNLLSDAREYRCCQEILSASGKLVSEGVAAACITGHPDFSAMTNATVLEQICPLLRDKRGRCYKLPAHGSRTAKNESLRASGYRFLARWIFGPLRWDNARPLPACIYIKLRRSFPTPEARGYSSSNQR